MRTNDHAPKPRSTGGRALSLALVSSVVLSCAESILSRRLTEALEPNSGDGVLVLESKRDSCSSMSSRTVTVAIVEKRREVRNPTSQKLVFIAPNS